MAKPRTSNWYGITVCKSCWKRLSDNQEMYSGGVCPKCGYNSGGTVCSTETVVLREIKHHPWWRFWNREITYEARPGDKLSQTWLQKNTE